MTYFHGLDASLSPVHKLNGLLNILGCEHLLPIDTLLRRRLALCRLIHRGRGYCHLLSAHDAPHLMLFFSGMRCERIVFFDTLVRYVHVQNGLIRNDLL